MSTIKQTEFSGPLAGVKVLDLTSVIMGPFATQILAQLGADVIKVEPPEGDNMRHVGPMNHPGMGPIFLHANAGKRSIVLDLKHPQGREAVLKLAEQCDVLISNVRPQALVRLGLDDASVRARNPRIIHVSCCGFDQEGPDAARPAYDDLIQGATGQALQEIRNVDGRAAHDPEDQELEQAFAYGGEFFVDAHRFPGKLPFRNKVVDEWARRFVPEDEGKGSRPPFRYSVGGASWTNRP